MELFPAVMIGGPPHSGKSVLAYSLTQALRARGTPHYVLRAYPDGEGDWANEADQQLVRRIRLKGEGTPEWIDRICRDIANRHLPLIVDVGGRPTRWQETIFDHCTHAILLTPNADARNDWTALATDHGVPILADLHSSLAGDDVIQTARPILHGQISRLERSQTAGGPTFQALVDLVADLFAYEDTELRQAHLSMAPTELVIELSRVGQTLGFGQAWWHWSPEKLPDLLDYLPANTPLGVYDRGPNWLYAALAWHTLPAQLYQFDVRLGWITPPELRLDPASPATPFTARLLHGDMVSQLEVTLTNNYLDYDEAAGLTFPPSPPDHGLIVSGKLPLWLWTALARTYRQMHWLAVFQPQLNQAVVIASQDEHKPIGSLVAPLV